jgi:hypothetical protein
MFHYVAMPKACFPGCGQHKKATQTKQARTTKESADIKDMRERRGKFTTIHGDARSPMGVALTTVADGSKLSTLQRSSSHDAQSSL